MSKYKKGYRKRSYQSRKNSVQLFFPALLIIAVTIFITDDKNTLKMTIIAAALLTLFLYILSTLVPKWRKKYYYRKANMYTIDRMSDRKFEDYLQVYFRDLGFKILPHRGGPGDKGADLILRDPEGLKVVVQAKRYSGKVPFEAVQQVHTARSLYEAERAIIISNYYLTKQALESAHALDIEVWDRDKLMKHLAIYRRKGA